MQNSLKQKHLRYIIAWSLLLNVVIGFTGSYVTSTGLQHLMWALSAFFMIIGSTLLGSKLTRDGHDIPAAGFIVISIAQAMSYGFIATHDAGTEQFGAVISIFIPGLILISFYDMVPMVIRIAGLISALAFAVLAIAIYDDIKSEAVRGILTLTGYLPMNVATCGWAWLVYKNKV